MGHQLTNNLTEVALVPLDENDKSDIDIGGNKYSLLVTCGSVTSLVKIVLRGLVR